MDFRATLKPRVEETIALLAHGYTAEEIADELCVAVGTVRNRIALAMEIVGAKKDRQLTAWFFYRTHGISLALAPKTKRLAAFGAIALFLFAVSVTDFERTARTRGRRRDETEQVGDDGHEYTA